MYSVTYVGYGSRVIYLCTTFLFFNITFPNLAGGQDWLYRARGEEKKRIVIRIYKWLRGQIRRGGWGVEVYIYPCTGMPIAGEFSEMIYFVPFLLQVFEVYKSTYRLDFHL